MLGNSKNHGIVIFLSTIRLSSIKGAYFKLYMVIDIFSRFPVGLEVWENEDAIYAEELIKKAVIREKIKGKPLVLHSDNGSPMKDATFQALLEKLGITKSYSRPRVSNDNPYSEAMFRTMKYRSEYPHEGFESLEAAREWAAEFGKWYAYEHQHSGLNFVTPHQAHTGEHIEILAKRKEVYEKAKSKHPERWSRTTRDWSPHQSVALNPMKDQQENE